MGKFAFVITFLSILILISCGESFDQYLKRQAESKLKFNAHISPKQKQLVRDFFTGKIQYGETFGGIRGGFYCLWKERDRDIYPQIELNDMFTKECFQITDNKDSLDFIIISESVSYKVGTYTNGGDATQIDVIISVIDIKKGLAYNLNNAKGSAPPATINRNAGSKSGAIGSFFGTEDTFDFLKTIIIK